MWHTITSVSTNYFIIAGEHAASFPRGIRIRVVGGNAGNYFVIASEQVGGNTVIYITPNAPVSGGACKLRKKKRPPDL